MNSHLVSLLLAGTALIAAQQPSEAARHAAPAARQSSAAGAQHRWWLRCDHLENVVGFDAGNIPQFMWVAPDTTRAVRLFLSTDSTLVKKGSKRALVATLPPGSRSHSLRQKLLPSTTYYWRVASGKSSSPMARLTTAVPLDGALWISDGHDASYLPAPVLRKTLTVSRPVRQALLTVASAGLHEAVINGTRVGDHRLDPMFTRFDRRVLSVTHDVTSLLHAGRDTLQLTLGNGWYNHQSTAVWLFHEAAWRNRPRMAAALSIDYADGSRDLILTDTTWLTATGDVVFNSIYTAEHQDARLKTGPSTVWQRAVAVDCPAQVVSSQMLEPIRAVSELAATGFSKLSDTLYVYTFPRNMAGVTSLRVRGERGTVVRLRHGELLDSAGRVTTANIDYHYRPTDDSDPFQTDIYTLSGGDDRFEPKFGYKGFQYVEVSSSRAVSLTPGSLVAKELHSDVTVTGSWKSSSELLNGIHRATRNSYLSNLFGYPTDCPQREKNGWTADAHLALEAGIYNFYLPAVFGKWLTDFRDEQQPDGTLPAIIPTDKWGYDWANGVDWTSAAILIPWQLYQYYGDSRLLADNYAMMSRYLARVGLTADGYLTSWGLGDWIPVSTESDITLTTSVYYYADAAIMSKVAAILGRQADAERFSALADNIRNAINNRFLDPATGIYASGSQTEQAMPLYWQVCPEELRAKVAARLHEAVAARGYHLDVGVLGCKAILMALTDNGYPLTAYRLATQESYPSWGWWIKQGATTLHENWRTDVIIDNTLNHIMFGEIGAWLYKGLAGIRLADDGQPAFRHTAVAPLFPDGLDWLDASLMTQYGPVAASWRRHDGIISYDLDVPAGMEVTFTAPSGQRQTLHAGHHHFTFND